MAKVELYGVLRSSGTSPSPISVSGAPLSAETGAWRCCSLNGTGTGESRVLARSLAPMLCLLLESDTSCCELLRPGLPKKTPYRQQLQECSPEHTGSWDCSTYTARKYAAWTRKEKCCHHRQASR